MDYAVYIGKHGDYTRDFGNGNKIELKQGEARPVVGEPALILKDAKDVVIFHTISDKPIDFKERMIRETYQDIVKKHGIRKAKEIYDKQKEEA